jgi:hypothetical protein
MVFAGMSGEDVWRVGQANGSIQLVVPQEGVPAVPAAAALPKGSPHPQAGALFLNFLLSPEAQRILSVDGFYPALSNESAPAGRIALQDLRLLQLPWKQTAQRGEDFYRRLRKSLKADANLSSSPRLLNKRLDSKHKTDLYLGERLLGPLVVGPPVPSHPCGWVGPKTVETRNEMVSRQ